MFKDRKRELRELEQSYSSGKPKLVIMYGRRRVGKTSIIQEFLKKHNGIYLLGRQETEQENLKRFSETISQFFNDAIIEKNPFRSWDALLSYLEEKLKEKRFAIAIDEFQYLASANRALPSILQDFWDNRLVKKQAFIILCGSSISMMESILGYKSPLYGRRTEQFLIEPLDFANAVEFFPENMQNEKKVEFYSILGGTPAYLMEFDYRESIEQNLLKNLLQKNKFLYQDVIFVLREELEEPRNYFAILRAIAKGKSIMNEIVQETGLDKGLVSKYISVLRDLHLIERITPIEKKKSARKGIYKIKDNFFRFWFRFVHYNEDYIEQNKQNLLLKEKIAPNFNQYIGEIFEDIALDYISKHKHFNNFIFGKWWNKDIEIDIIGLSKERVIFAEVKWKNVNKDEALSILENLKEKSQSYPKEKKSEAFGIIAKNIPNKEEIRKKGYVALDLRDIFS